MNFDEIPACAGMAGSGPHEFRRDPGLRRDGRLRAAGRPYEPATFIRSMRTEPTVFAP